MLSVFNNVSDGVVTSKIPLGLQQNDILKSEYHSKSKSFLGFQGGCLEWCRTPVRAGRQSAGIDNKETMQYPEQDLPGFEWKNPSRVGLKVHKDGRSATYYGRRRLVGIETNPGPSVMKKDVKKTSIGRKVSQMHLDIGTKTSFKVHKSSKSRRIKKSFQLKDGLDKTFGNIDVSYVNEVGPRKRMESNFKDRIIRPDLVKVEKKVYDKEIFLDHFGMPMSWRARARAISERGERIRREMFTMKKFCNVKIEMPNIHFDSNGNKLTILKTASKSCLKMQRDKSEHNNNFWLALYEIKDFNLKFSKLVLKKAYPRISNYIKMLKKERFNLIFDLSIKKSYGVSGVSVPVSTNNLRRTVNYDILIRFNTRRYTMTLNQCLMHRIRIFSWKDGLKYTHNRRAMVAGNMYMNCYYLCDENRVRASIKQYRTNSSVFKTMMMYGTYLKQTNKAIFLFNANAEIVGYDHAKIFFAAFKLKFKSHLDYIESKWLFPRLEDVNVRFQHDHGLYFIHDFKMLNFDFKEEMLRELKLTWKGKFLVKASKKMSYKKISENIHEGVDLKEIQIRVFSDQFIPMVRVYYKTLQKVEEALNLSDEFILEQFKPELVKGIEDMYRFLKEAGFRHDNLQYIEPFVARCKFALRMLPIAQMGLIGVTIPDYATDKMAEGAERAGRNVRELFEKGVKVDHNMTNLAGIVQDFGDMLKETAANVHMQHKLHIPIVSEMFNSMNQEGLVSPLLIKLASILLVSGVSYAASFAESTITKGMVAMLQVAYTCYFVKDPILKVLNSIITAIPLISDLAEGNVKGVGQSKVSDVLTKFITIPVLGYFYAESVYTAGISTYTDAESNGSSFVSNFLKKIKGSFNNKKDVNEMVEFISEQITDFLGYLGEHFDVELLKNFNVEFPELKKLADRFSGIVKELKTAPDYTKDNAKIFYTLRAEIENLKGRTQHIQANAGFHKCADELLKRMQPFTEMFKSRNFETSGPRCAPFAYCLAGDTNVGKSLLAPLIANGIMKNNMSDKLWARHMADPNATTYEYKAEREFCDRYSQNYRINIDEFGILKEQGAGTELSYLQLCYIINNANHAFEGAALAFKDNLDITSSLVTMTTNVRRFNLPSFVLPAAIIRRVIWIQQYVREEYALKVNGKVPPPWDRQMDPNKVDMVTIREFAKMDEDPNYIPDLDKINIDVCAWQEYIPAFESTGKVHQQRYVSGAMTCLQAIKYLSDKMKVHELKERGFHNFNRLYLERFNKERIEEAISIKPKERDPWDRVFIGKKPGVAQGKFKDFFNKKILKSESDSYSTADCELGPKFQIKRNSDVEIDALASELSDEVGIQLKEYPHSECSDELSWPYEDCTEEEMDARIKRKTKEAEELIMLKKNNYVKYMARSLQIDVCDSWEVFKAMGSRADGDFRNYYNKFIALKVRPLCDEVQPYLDTFMDFLYKHKGKLIIASLISAVGVATLVWKCASTLLGVAQSGVTRVVRNAPRKAMPKIVLHNIKGKAQSMQFNKGTLDVISKIVRKCEVEIDVYDEDVEIASGSSKMLFVGDGVGICSNHFYSYCCQEYEGYIEKGKEYPPKPMLLLKLRNLVTGCAESIYFKDVVDHVRHIDGTPEDLVWWNFRHETGFLPKTNIVNLFMDSSNAIWKRDFHGAIILKRVMESNGQKITNFIPMPSLIENSGKEDYFATEGSDVVYSMDTCLKTNIQTFAGDCISALVAADSGIRNGKIMGVHIMHDGEHSVGIPVTKQMVQAALNSFGVTIDPVPEDYDPPEPDQVKVGQCNFPKKFEVVDFIPPMASSNQTSIEPTIFNENDVFPKSKKPVDLSDEKHDTFIFGFGDDAVPIEADRLSMVTRYFISRLKYSLRNAEPILNYSIKQAIEGFEGFKSLPRGTDGGLPWCLEPFDSLVMNGRLHTKKFDKKYCFGREGEFTYGPEANLIIEQAKLELEELNRGQIFKTVYKEFKKDECLLNEKADRKLRGISGASANTSIAVRVAFGPAMQILNENPTASGMLMGLNVYSADFHYMVKNLQKFDQYEHPDPKAEGFSIIYDHAKWDQGCKPQMHNRVAEVCDAISDPLGIYKEARLWFCRNLGESYHAVTRIVNGKRITIIFRRNNGQMSGNPITLGGNNIQHQLELRLAISYILYPGSYEPGTYEGSMIENNLVAYTQGDDIVLSVGPELIKRGVNPESLTAAFAKLGRTITDDGKTGQAIRWRKVDYTEESGQTSPSILQRFMRYCNYTKRYVAPLRETSIYCILNWQKKSTTYKEKCANARLAVLEFSLYGEEKWKLKATPIIEASKKYLDYEIPEDSFKEAIAACLKLNSKIC